MKEYIEKENILKTMIENDMSLGHVRLINNCTTVTEAKICRKFLNKVAIKCPKTLLELWETIDMMLAEMEKEND